MRKIGLISDTHNYLDPQISDFFSDRDEIWHAGDFGSLKIAESLEEVAPVIGVYGNIDGNDLFICGHSHILKIARDQSLNKMLYMNPGAAGKQGFQVYRTIVRFSIDSGKIHDVEVINLGQVGDLTE